jgi:FG-GAP-like repeat
MKIRNLLPALIALCSFLASVKPASAAGTNVLNIQPFAVTTFTLIPNGNFAQPAIPLSVGNSPQSVVAADVNNDGKVDLISANNDDSTLTVLINDGTGNFEDTFDYDADTVNAVVAADVNGDGNVDLISANASSPSGTLTVYTNDGSGGFFVASSPSVGRHPSSLVAADIYGNDKPALINANAVNNTLTVLTNMGGGIFVSNTSYSVGSQPESVIAADVNNDGKLDLICADFSDNNLIVLTNNGSGGFVAATTNSVGNHPNSVVAADVNGDGKVDLICANENSPGTLTVLTNAGGGIFVHAATLDASAGVGNNPFAVTAADVNGDGKVDLVCANNGDNTLTVLTNDGSGGFVLASVVGVGGNPQSVVAADIDGDGVLDLISANNGDSTLSVALATPTILTNNVNGIGISWSTNSDGFVLQQNPDLSLTNWVDVPTVPVVTNALNLVTAPFTGGGQLFYRLRHP